MWDSHSGEVEWLLENSDGSIVNNIAPHPLLPVLATCGLDHYATVWEVGPWPDQIQQAAESAHRARLISRNRIMRRGGL